MKKLFYLLPLFSILFLGCSEDGLGDGGDGGNGSGGSGGPNGSAKEVAGYVQKGPFVTGTSVTIHELTDQLIPTGKSFAAQIKDDSGSFKVSGEFSESYAEIVANGFYFNEVTNRLSGSPITLRTLSNLSGKENVNINILTTLQLPRMQKLIADGKTFKEAVAQSQKEVLKAFSIEQESAGNSFDQWTIAQKGEDNAILLAISSIMQDRRSEAELSELIAKVANDIEDNGVLDAQNLKESITLSSASIDNNQVQKNLYERFVALGMTDVSIPDFYGYLDSDGDGVLNNKKPYVNCPETYVLIRTGVTTYTLNWASNCLPKVKLPDGCDWIHVVECTSEKLQITLDETTHNRQALLSVCSPDDVVLNEIMIEQQGTAMFFQIGMRLPGTRRSNEYTFFDDKVSELYIAAFDNQGRILFVHNDKQPVISYNTYHCYLELEKSIFRGCTIYIIANSPYDFSNFQGTLTDFRNLEVDADLSTAQNLENFYMGEVGDWTINNSIDQDPTVELPAPIALMTHPVAKVECSVTFADKTEHDVVSSLTLNGKICYRQGSFFKQVSNGDTDLKLTVSENNKFVTYLYQGAFIDAFDFKLGNGKTYQVETASIDFRANNAYRYTILVDGDNASISMVNKPDDFNSSNDFEIN